jgi:hypothetical protein
MAGRRDGQNSLPDPFHIKIGMSADRAGERGDKEGGAAGLLQYAPRATGQLSRVFVQGVVPTGPQFPIQPLQRRHPCPWRRPALTDRQRHEGFLEQRGDRTGQYGER